MSLRSRLCITVATGALLATAAAAPAVAADSGEAVEDRGGWSQYQQYPDKKKPKLYKGVVTANKLYLRSAPTRGSKILRTAHKGEVVKIFCKAPGEVIEGNPLWYLLPDGTWAWGSARYIKNIGPAPRWC